MPSSDVMRDDSEGNTFMLKNKKLIIAVKIVAFVLIFCLMAECLGMLVYPKTGETTPKMVIYRQQKETPDVLMLGTSAMFRAIMPLLLDEVTGLETVDMCTPAQTMLSSYTLLKDSISQGKVPDTLILYTNIRRFCREKTSNYDYQVMANLPLSLDKLEMMYHGFSVDECWRPAPSWRRCRRDGRRCGWLHCRSAACRSPRRRKRPRARRYRKGSAC